MYNYESLSLFCWCLVIVAVFNFVFRFIDVYLFFFHSRRRHRIPTAVYQVTRPGHEHCDATEGILLDITPLVVDGKKLVTLYDKDLTEGVNLLIGMYVFNKSIFCHSLLLNKSKVNYKVCAPAHNDSVFNVINVCFVSPFCVTVVSDLWGPQCVRLKVTVKSDNCGENAQCSGKGVCFSNASMVCMR